MKDRQGTNGAGTPPDPQPKVTMTDVARAAGCSQATVSIVLKNAPGVRISAETRARVIQAARTLNYATTTMAHLATPDPGPAHGTELFGFVVDQLATSPEAVVAIEGARQAAWDEGGIIIAAQTMNDTEMEEKTIAALARSGVAGLVYMTIFTRKITLPSALTGLGLPIALLNCYSSDHRLPSVVPGEAEGGHAATRHLIEAGHRRIAMITGEPWMEAARDRARGYRRALSEAGIGFDPALVTEGNWSPSSGYENTRRLLALPDRPSAIFCQNDRMAIGCYEAIKDAGLHIPDDISVVGYDDEEISRHLYPQLTTVVLPHRLMGHWAIERLKTQSSLTRDRHPQEVMPCTLIARASVRDLNRQPDGA